MRDPLPVLTSSLVLFGIGAACSGSTETTPRDRNLLPGLWVQGTADTLVIYPGLANTRFTIGRTHGDQAYWIGSITFLESGEATTTSLLNTGKAGQAASGDASSLGAYTYDVSSSSLTFRDPHPASIPQFDGNWDNRGPPPPLVP
jgi:hypothetical protein